MKNLISLSRLGLMLGVISFVAMTAAWAADTAASPQIIVTGAPSADQSAAPAPPPSEPAPVKLPYGVEDVLKLSRAQVSDDIIVNYVQNSGTIYNLSPNDIVYIRNQGVSERVIGSMLDQRRRVTEVAAQAAPQSAPAPYAAAPQPTYDAANSTAAAAPPTYAAPAPAQTQSAASTLYVIPYPQATSAYYGYPYYYPYYSGYYGPSVSVGFGFGGCWPYYGGCYRGGYYHGGYYRGGYYRGGHSVGFHGSGHR